MINRGEMLMPELMIVLKFLITKVVKGDGETMDFGGRKFIFSFHR